MNSACAIIVHHTGIYKQLEHPAISSPFENHDGRGREITSQFLSGENLLALMVSAGEACSMRCLSRVKSMMEKTEFLSREALLAPMVSDGDACPSHCNFDCCRRDSVERR